MFKFYKAALYKDGKLHAKPTIQKEWLNDEEFLDFKTRMELKGHLVGIDQIVVAESRP